MDGGSADASFDTASEGRGEGAEIRGEGAEVSAVAAPHAAAEGARAVSIGEDMRGIQGEPQVGDGRDRRRTMWNLSGSERAAGVDREESEEEGEIRAPIPGEPGREEGTESVPITDERVQENATTEANQGPVMITDKQRFLDLLLAAAGEQAQDECRRMTNEIEALKLQLREREAATKAIEQEKQELTTENEELKIELEQTRNDRDKAEAEMRALKDECAELSENLAKQQDILTQLVEMQDNAEEKVRVAKQECEALERDFARLKILHEDSLDETLFACMEANLTPKEDNEASRRMSSLISDSTLGAEKLASKTEIFLRQLKATPATDAASTQWDETMCAILGDLKDFSMENDIRFPEKTTSVGDFDKKLEDVRAKAKQLKPASKREIHVGGGIVFILEQIAKAFHQCNLVHLAAVFSQKATIAEVTTAYREAYDAEDKRRSSTGKHERSEQLRLIAEQDQKLIFAAVGGMTRGLSATIEDQVAGTRKTKDVRITELASSGFILLAIAERELIQPDPNDMVIRLSGILTMVNQYSDRFHGNYGAYVKHAIDAILGFQKDYASITPRLLLDAVLLPVLTKYKGASESEWRERLEIKNEWQKDVGTQHYKHVRNNLPKLSKDLIQYQLDNAKYADLFTKPIMPLHEYLKETGNGEQGGMEITFALVGGVAGFRQDTAPTCSSCGRAHEAGRCLRDDNLRKAVDVLTPQVKLLDEALGRMQKAMSKIQGDAEKKDFKVSLDKIKNVAGALSNSIFGPDNRNPKQKASVNNVSEAADTNSTNEPKTSDTTLQALKDEIADLKCLVANVQRREDRQKQRVERSAIQIASILDAHGLPKDLCLKHAMEGQKCVCREKQRFNHDRKYLDIIKMEKVCRRKGCRFPRYVEGSTTHDCCSKTCSEAFRKEETVNVALVHAAVDNDHDAGADMAAAVLDLVPTTTQELGDAWAFVVLGEEKVSQAEPEGADLSCVVLDLVPTTYTPATTHTSVVEPALEKSKERQSVASPSPSIARRADPRKTSGLVIRKPSNHLSGAPYPVPLGGPPHGTKLTLSSSEDATPSLGGSGGYAPVTLRLDVMTNGQVRVHFDATKRPSAEDRVGEAASVDQMLHDAMVLHQKSATSIIEDARALIAHQYGVERTSYALVQDLCALDYGRSMEPEGYARQLRAAARRLLYDYGLLEVWNRPGFPEGDERRGLLELASNDSQACTGTTTGQLRRLDDEIFLVATRTTTGASIDGGCFRGAISTSFGRFALLQNMSIEDGKADDKPESSRPTLEPSRVRTHQSGGGGHRKRRKHRRSKRRFHGGLSKCHSFRGEARGGNTAGAGSSPEGVRLLESTRMAGRDARGDGLQSTQSGGMVGMILSIVSILIGCVSAGIQWAGSMAFRRQILWITAMMSISGACWNAGTRMLGHTLPPSVASRTNPIQASAIFDRVGHRRASDDQTIIQRLTVQQATAAAQYAHLLRADLTREDCESICAIAKRDRDEGLTRFSPDAREQLVIMRLAERLTIMRGRMAGSHYRPRSPQGSRTLHAIQARDYRSRRHLWTDVVTRHEKAGLQEIVDRASAEVWATAMFQALLQTPTWDFDDLDLHDVLTEDIWQQLGLANLSHREWLDYIPNIDVEDAMRTQNIEPKYYRRYTAEELGLRDDRDGYAREGDADEPGDCDSPPPDLGVQPSKVEQRERTGPVEHGGASDQQPSGGECAASFLDCGSEKGAEISNDIEIAADSDEAVLRTIEEASGPDPYTADDEGSNEDDDWEKEVTARLPHRPKSIRPEENNAITPRCHQLDDDQDKRDTVPDLLVSSGDEDDGEQISVRGDIAGSVRLQPGSEIVTVDYSKNPQAINHLEQHDLDGDDDDFEPLDNEDVSEQHALDHSRRRHVIALSCVNKIRALRLTELVRYLDAYPCLNSETSALYTVVKDFKLTKVDGICLWLGDTGSTAWVSSEPEHVLVPKSSCMMLKGVGSARCSRTSNGVLSTIDTEGLYNTMTWATVYNLDPGSELNMCIASIGSMERMGYAFHFDADNPHYETPAGRKVRLLTDRVTGFHFIIEYLFARPSVQIRQLITQRVQADVTAGKPSQHEATMFEAPIMEKPSAQINEEGYDELLRRASSGGVGWNLNRRPIDPNQRIIETVEKPEKILNVAPADDGSNSGKCVRSKLDSMDKEALSENQSPERQNIRTRSQPMHPALKGAKCTKLSCTCPLCNQFRRKDGMWKERSACWNRPGCKCPKCRDLYDGNGDWDEAAALRAGSNEKPEEDIKHEPADKDKVAAAKEEEMGDEEYFRMLRKERERLGFRKPIRLRLPAVRLDDTGEAKDVRKLKDYVHSLFGHLELSTIFRAVDHMDGAEILRILKAVRGSDTDAHCEDCCLNKLNLPPMPKGRTTRPMNIRKVEKMYVDLLGYIKEASVYHNYHYLIGGITDLGFVDLVGLSYKTQSILGLAKIISHFGEFPGDIQIDGEGSLNTEQAVNWLTGKGHSRTSKVTITEAYNPFRNAKIERKWDTLKKMSRCMLSKAGMSSKYWYFAMKMAAVINNIVMLVRDENGEIVKSTDTAGRQKTMTAYEAHFGERPDVQRLLLGPFGCMAYLILTEEQRRARGFSSSFGVRAISGMYLGPEICAKTGVYHHLMTDGRTIFTSPHNIKVIPDVFPAASARDASGEPDLSELDEVAWVTVDDDYEKEIGKVPTNSDWYWQAWYQAMREAASNEQAEINYVKEESETVFAARKAKAKVQTKKAKGPRKPGQIVETDERDAQHDKAMEEGEDPNLPASFEEPDDYMVPELVDEYVSVEPYNGAKYKILVPRNFKDPEQAPTKLHHPHDRFVGRRVRKSFPVADRTGKTVSRDYEGTVRKYSQDRQLFAVDYDDGDVEEYDFQDLSQILLMGTKYGDADADEGKTRAEKTDQLKKNAICNEVSEHLWNIVLEKAHEAYEKFESRVGKPGDDETSEHGTLSVPVPDDKPVIYDDEPRNSAEVLKHPEKEAILESARKEMQQMIDMDIGVLLTPGEIQDLLARGDRILRAKMVYKRKYAISPTTNKESFLKWKARLAVDGSRQTLGLDTVWNTFSPTVGFTAIRTMISVLCNPKFYTSSFDLSGAFLGSTLDDHAVYVRFPPDAGEYANRVVRLTKAVYGIKNSGSSFMAQLGEEILKFEERVDSPKRSSTCDASTTQSGGAGQVEYARFQRMLSDQCIYTYRDSAGREMVFLSYVDDIICATNDLELRDRFFAHIQKRWNVTCEGTLDRFLAVNFKPTRDGWGWSCNMSAYIEKIALRFDLTETRVVKTPLDPGFVLTEEDFEAEPTEEMITEMRSMIGSMAYAMTAVRYDIAYAVSVLSRHLARPCKRVLDAARRVIMYLYQTREFTIEWWSSKEEIETGRANVLTGSVDASFAMDQMTRRSHGGYINFINGGAVSWKSGLQPIVTLSSCEAEYVALCSEVCEVKYLRNLLEELGHRQEESTLIWEDNRAAILVAQQECSSAGRCKHIDLRFRFVAMAVFACLRV